MGLAEIFGILILLMIVVFAIAMSFMKDEDDD
jgi:flagellin-like protein